MGAGRHPALERNWWQAGELQREIKTETVFLVDRNLLSATSVNEMVNYQLIWAGLFILN